MKIFYRLLCISLCIAGIYPDVSAQETFYDNIEPAKIVVNHKTDRLDSKGMKIPGAVVVFESDDIGRCLGTVIECRKAFRPTEYRFRISACKADGAILKLVLNRINEDGSQTSIIDAPVLFSLQHISDGNEYYVEASHDLMLTPGQYFIGMELMSISGEDPTILFPAYVKKSFSKEPGTDSLAEFPYNIGLSISGKKI